MKRWLLLLTLVCNLLALRTVDFQNLQAIDYALIATFAIVLAVNACEWVVKNHAGR